MWGNSPEPKVKLGIYLIDFMGHHGTIALPELRVFSSVGRATALQAVGRRFDPCNTHQVIERDLSASALRACGRDDGRLAFAPAVEMTVG